MNAPWNEHAELAQLLEQLCEDRLPPEGYQRIEQLTLQSGSARRFYVSYLQLHGSLFWDAASAQDAQPVLVGPSANAETVNATVSPALAAIQSSSPAQQPKVALQRSLPSNRSGWPRVATVASLAVVALLAVTVVGLRDAWLPPAGEPLAHQPTTVSDGSGTATVVVADPPDTPSMGNSTVSPQRVRQPVQLGEQRPDNLPESVAVVDGANKAAAPGAVSQDPAMIDDQSAARDEGIANNVRGRDLAEFDASVVAAIDRQLADSWDAAGVVPAAAADDATWVRRVYLDLAGRIPTVSEVEAFLADRRNDKRDGLVDQLLASPEFARHFATEWTNLLIGRAPANGVDRFGLEKYLRHAVMENRPWNQLVYELIAAEGRSDEQPATNFLLAHLNNQAVPATAITARLFLGEQVQCLQCHNHPSSQGKQSTFWALNSCFQQTERTMLSVPAQRPDEPRKAVLALVNRSQGGPIFYENRQGLMLAAYPQFRGTEIDPEASVNRRAELARLMTTGSQPQLSTAFVNRLWAHFFGYGFSRPVDDLGPHNPPSHPELVESLQTAFIDSGYDVRRLVKWITASRAYRLSSRPARRIGGKDEVLDDPSAGDPPLFSRMYLKSMSVEQLCDSLAVATGAHRRGASDWVDAERQREQLLSSFIVQQQNEENTEANTFEGTIHQALLMMNGPLIEEALATDSGTVLAEILKSHSGETERLRQISLAALSRMPTERELAAYRRNLIASRGGRGGKAGLVASDYQDLFWAMLNSNEFVINH